MSDTPRTDSVAYDVGGFQHEHGAIVGSEFSRQLERELNAANERIKRLEQQAESKKPKLHPFAQGLLDGKFGECSFTIAQLEQLTNGHMFNPVK